MQRKGQIKENELMDPADRLPIIPDDELEEPDPDLIINSHNMARAHGQKRFRDCAGRQFGVLDD